LNPRTPKPSNPFGRVAVKYSLFPIESKMMDVPQTEERIIIGGENDVAAVRSPPGRLPSEVLRKFEGKSREVSAAFGSFRCFINTVLFGLASTELYSAICFCYSVKHCV